MINDSLMLCSPHYFKKIRISALALLKMVNLVCHLIRLRGCGCKLLLRGRGRLFVYCVRVGFVCNQHNISLWIIGILTTILAVVLLDNSCCVLPAV